MGIRDKFPVGRHTYGEPHILHWGENATLKIGSFCSISADIKIFLGGNHRTDWITTFPFNSIWPNHKHIIGHPATKGDVIIGNDVWVGWGATILSGITIGNGAVIGAYSVVTKNVPAYAIVAGNPATVKKMRFSDENILFLEQCRWWDWPDEKINRAVSILQFGDIEKLKIFCESN